METLIIESTPVTPFVIFNPIEGRFELSGHSRPEDGKRFFFPLIKYINDYQEKIGNRQTVEGIKSDNFSFIFKFSYINSASSKFLCEFLFHVLKFKNIGVSFTIEWYYEENDDDMKELGEDISDIIDYPFYYYSYSPEEE